MDLADQGGPEETGNNPKMRINRKSTKKIRNRTLAILEDMIANLEKPKIPAMAANRKNNRAIRSKEFETKTTSFLTWPGSGRRGRNHQGSGVGFDQLYGGQRDKPKVSSYFINYGLLSFLQPV